MLIDYGAELLNSTTDFEQASSYTSTVPETSTNVAAIIPSEKENNLLLISTAVACTVIIVVLVVVCIIVAVVFVRQLRRKRLDLTHDIELYTEVENGIPIYEAVDKGLDCAQSNNEVDMSYVDMCEGFAPDPVYDTADIKLEAAEETPRVDETLKSTKCCDLPNNDTHYQNLQDSKYSHYSSLPQHQINNLFVQATVIINDK